MISCLTVDAGALGAVDDIVEGLVEIAVCGVGGLLAVGVGLGVGGRVGDRDGDELGVVAAGDVDGDVERAQRDVRAVPGEQDSLKHQLQDGDEGQGDDQRDQHVQQVGGQPAGLERAHAFGDPQRKRGRGRVEEAVDGEHDPRVRASACQRRPLAASAARRLR